jgi:amidase
MTHASDLSFAGARDLAQLLHTRKLSARELMSACLDSIRRVNPRLNALVAKLDDDACLALAAQADQRLSRNEPTGPLHGLPFAFKDMEAAVGFPWTRGSPIFRNAMPAEDSFIVERLRKAGVIPIAKTNVPEFAMGSHTYNTVYGTTLNPYDPTRSAGGSSGGAGAALASGMLPLADGSDLGGSLRNPANFNNIVALRPTVGLVPAGPALMPLLGFNVKGPMARSTGDAAFLLSVMADPDARDPLTYPCDPSLFARPLARDFKGVRVAWCPDLGGLPLDRRVRDVLDAQDAHPDFAGADEVFMTLRSWNSWTTLGPLLEAHRHEMKPEAIWQLELGSRVKADQIARAMIAHGEIMQRMRRFQERYEFLLCAVNQVPPFDATLHWPREIDGVAMENYVGWMKTCWYITVTFCPALSVPAGFTPDGLPVGVQIVGRRRDDFGVLQLGHAFEEATGFGRRRPPVASAN